MFGAYRFYNGCAHFHIQIRRNKHPICIETSPTCLGGTWGRKIQGLGTRGPETYKSLDQPMDARVNVFCDLGVGMVPGRKSPDVFKTQ